MLKQYFAGSALLASLLFYTGCGGGGDSTTSTTTYSTGVFVDAPVANLDYNCSSGSTGTTNTKGEYQYAANGDKCTFKAGNVILGEVNASKIVTPKDLFGLNDFNDSRVINLAAFLWSLDSDNNVTNGIQIDKTLVSKFDTNITDPDDLFDDIEELFEQFFDDDENFAQELNATLQNPTTILAHLEDSEMEAEYLYASDTSMLDIGRSDIENRTFTIIDDDNYTTLSFYSDGSVEFTGELEDSYGTFNGSWTILEKYLVINLRVTGYNAPYQIYAAFQSLTDSEAKFIAITPDGLDAARASVAAVSMPTATTLSFTPKPITFSDIANKSLEVEVEVGNYLTINFMPDGTYSQSDGTQGYWSVVGNYIVTQNTDINGQTYVSYIAFENNATLETNSTFSVYGFDDEAGEYSVKVLDDLNSTQPQKAFDDRVAISHENFRDKLFTYADSNIKFAFEYDGEFKMYSTTDNSEIAEGGWTIVDNYLVLSGAYKSTGEPFVKFIAFTSVGSTSADFISLTKDGIVEGSFSITNYED